MRTPSPAVAAVVAVLALALASGGIGYAAGSLPKNSVASKQIKNGAVKGVDLQDNAVTSAKVKDNAVTGAKVQDNSLTGADIDEGSLSLPVPPLEPGSVLISHLDFRPRSSATTIGNPGAGYVFETAFTDFLTAPIVVPDGATVTTVEVYVMDNGAEQVVATVVRYPVAGAPGQVESPPKSPTLESSGVQNLAVNVNQVVNDNATLSVLVRLPLTNTYRLYGAKVNYV